MTIVCRKCGDRGYLIEMGGETAVAKVCACRSPCPKCGDTGWWMELADGRPVSKPCDCRHLRRHVSHYNDAGIPARMHRCQLENFEDKGGTQGEVKAHLKRFRQAFRPGNRGLLLWGPPGTGKTHLATALLHYFTLERGYTARFQDFFHLLSDLKAAYGLNRSEDAILGPLVDVDVLVIDELGKGRASEWEISVLDQLVSRRYNAQKTIVATTNFDVTDTAPGPDAASARLIDRVDGRIYSRLREMCDFHEVNGPDWRKRG